jgi:hypothetical protein
VIGHHLCAALLIAAALFAFDSGNTGAGAVCCALVLGVLIDASAQRGRRW